MKRRGIYFASCMALVLGAACNDVGPVERTQQRSNGLVLTASLVEGTDVGAMHFLITPCLGGPAVVDMTVQLKEMDLPAGLVEFEGYRFDEESQHRFADYFVAVPPGCYDVVVQPMSPDGDGGWEPSFDCAPAFENGVTVVGEHTTEIMLISQCMGDEIGGLDVIAALNREPEIDDLTFEPNKFVGDCEGTVVCVTASDPDCDPLEIVFEQTSGPALAPTPISQERDGCAVTQCVRFQPTEIAAYEFEVTAYDLLVHGDAMVRIEDWLAAHGYPNDSHASLEFPIYSGVECPPPPPPPPPPPCGCTLTQGYWKTHNKYALNPSQNIPWPDPMDEDQMLCDRSLLANLWTPTLGRAFYILSHQYIAAKLNVAAGACTTLCVDEALAAAEVLLAGCWIPCEERLFAEHLAEVLDAFNNGVIGPGHCDDPDPS